MIVTGTLKKFIRKFPNGSALYEINPCDGSIGSYRIMGAPPCIPIGFPISVEGDMRDGLFFTSGEPKINDPALMIKFLSSGKIACGSEKLISALVKAVPNCDIFEFVKNDIPDIKLKGFSTDSVKNALIKTRDLKKGWDFLKEAEKQGLSYKAAYSIWNKYGPSSYFKTFTCTYDLCKDGIIDFATADRIALKCGISDISSQRLECAVTEALIRAASAGSSFLYLKEFKNKISFCQCSDEDGEYGVPLFLIFRSIMSLGSKDQIKIVESPEGTKVYLRRYYEAERLAAHNISRIDSANISYGLDDALIDDIMSEIGFAYSDEQYDALSSVSTSGIKVITGGPGTGKTTVVAGMVKYLAAKKRSFALCAPTGRAAKRLSEVTGYPASTIHRLLKLQPFASGDSRLSGIHLDEDVIIVDEMSMVGIEVFAALLSSIKTGSTVILIGDTDQLSSVDTGKVLSDAIRYKKDLTETKNV